MSDRNPDYDSAALQLFAASTEGAMVRFLQGLPEHMRKYHEETLQLKDELLSNVQRMLIGDAREAVQHATWVAKHSADVAYRWAVLRDALTKWSLYQVPSFKVVLR